MRISDGKAMGGLYEEVPKIATLRRYELERACDHFNIPYDASNDGAYILQRRLSHLDESDVLRAIGRIDLLGDAEAAEDLRERLGEQQGQIDELRTELQESRDINERLLAALERLQDTEAKPEPEPEPDEPHLPDYSNKNLPWLRSETKRRGLKQSPKDTVEIMRQRLVDSDQGLAVPSE